jgi:hypothetical protein
MKMPAAVPELFHAIGTDGWTVWGKLMGAPQGWKATWKCNAVSVWTTTIPLVIGRAGLKARKQVQSRLAADIEKV